jgi:hypothetical protein
MKTKNIALSMLPFIIISCGGSGGGGDKVSPSPQEEINREAEIDGSHIQGNYIARFDTLNSQVVGTIPGSMVFQREENQIKAFVRIFAGSPSIAHFQNIHSGTRCPTMSDDTNGDGFLDIQETIAVAGKVIVPLDWDIGSQLSGNRSWPLAFPNGSYEYTKIASFQSFWNDLNRDDERTEDHIIKAKDMGVFNPVGRVVIVQGVDSTKSLPESVAGLGQWKNYQTLPITCGILLEAPTTSPGEEYSGSIPGPIDSSDWVSKPAPEGEGEIPGSGTVIPGPSNSSGDNDSTSGSDTNTGSTGSTNPSSSEPERQPEVENSDEVVSEDVPETEVI